MPSESSSTANQASPVNQEHPVNHKPPHNSAHPTVALLVETSTTWGSDIVRGASSYAQEQGGWFFYLEPRGRYEELQLPAGWRGDGIIARVSTAQLAEQIIQSQLPAVNVSWFDHGESQIARCMPDEAQAGRAAADHFLERGFQSFAYCGALRRPEYRDRLYESFVSRIETAGFKTVVYPGGPSPSRPEDWKTALEKMASWLKTLPKPCGLFSWNDVRGRQVSEACKLANIRVPDEIAILGGEEDELTGAICNPQLSTIDLAPRQVGYESAKLLHQMMQGAPVPQEPVLLDIGGVLTRPSTDTLAIEDRLLSDALRLIRERAHDGITIAEVLQHVPISRRKLEQRFNEVIGRTPAAELRRLRLERAKRLLADTSLPIPKVATASGFREPACLTRTFRRVFDQTPSAYRKEIRKAGQRG